ncbi:hypothetical protein R69658_07835 [Paraburkholderia aspalathi]|uniref:Holin-X, holin superfamily III n=1 Tax=Paraburkholderia aspalathi TaxID=1324617 RepID=A0ABM8T7L5_9BURK|nr:hypothetical protein [Paraburkholderia aspalathi]MBK3824102.1 hypothetical protein [Paraburkholderia aspalathi]MBK3835944.1 hypothetical protein [Paraburkholderia aspalathi]MBK3865722.1 hypothetical protein [Paraburkholderia aspalathi]CAE6865461.1 hypothetical protein R69658_07835 [Paraburkholderia aspalathi]
MRRLGQVTGWVRTNGRDLLSFAGGASAALGYLWWWAHGGDMTLLDRILSLALGVTGAVIVAGLAVFCGMWLTLSKGTRYDEHK